MADPFAMTTPCRRIQLIIPCSSISSSSSISSLRYVSLPLFSLNLPFSPTRRSLLTHSSHPNSAHTHLIATHEHTDGSLIFRFGDSSEVVESDEWEESKGVGVNVEDEESKGVKENSGSEGVGNLGLMSGKSGKHGVVEVSSVKGGKENVRKQKNVKPRTIKRKKSKLVETSGLAEDGDNKNVLVKSESDVDSAAEMKTSSSIGFAAVSVEGLEARKVSFEKEGLDEFSSSVAVSKFESSGNVKSDIASAVVLKEKSGSEETAAHLPSSVVNSETEVPSAIKGSEDEMKAEVQGVITAVEADNDDQMSRVTDDDINDKQPTVNEEEEAAKMYMIKNGVIDAKEPNIINEDGKVGTTQMIETPEDGVIVGEKLPVINEDIEGETKQMPKTLEDDIVVGKQVDDATKEDLKGETAQMPKTRENHTVVGKQPGVTKEDAEVETTQTPKTLEDDIVVGKKLVDTTGDIGVETTQMSKKQENGIALVTNEDAGVETTPMLKTEEDDSVTGKQPYATKEDSELKVTLMPKTEADNIVDERKPNLTNEDIPNITYQDAKVQTKPILKTEEDDIVVEKQPNVTNEDAQNISDQDAKRETIPMSKAEEDDIALGKKPNVTNDDVEVETTEAPKTQEEDIVVETQPNITSSNAEVESVQMSKTQEVGIVGKQQNFTNGEVEKDTTHLPKTFGDGITAERGPNGTDEDITVEDLVELLPVLQMKETVLDEEATTEALDGSFQTDDTGSLKLVDGGALNLKREVKSIQQDSVGSPNLSTLQDEEPQSTTGILNRDQEVAERLVLISGVASLRNTSEVLAGREDAYFVCDNWLGVADGVGQWALEGTKAGLYAQDLMKNCQRIVTECKSSTVSKPENILLRAAAETGSQGSSTLLLAHFDGQALHVANIGDSGFMLIRNGMVYAKSSPMHHDFNFPVHFGSDDDPSKLIERYKIEMEEGDVVVTATDGLFDNLYEQEVALMVTKSLQGKLKAEEIAKLLASSAQEVGQSASARSPFADAAQAAGYVGYTGGKLDDITVIVSLVQ